MMCHSTIGIANRLSSAPAPPNLRFDLRFVRKNNPSVSEILQEFLNLHCSEHFDNWDTRCVLPRMWRHRLHVVRPARARPWHDPSSFQAYRRAWRRPSESEKERATCGPTRLLERVHSTQIHTHTHTHAKGHARTNTRHTPHTSHTHTQTHTEK